MPILEIILVTLLTFIFSTRPSKSACFLAVAEKLFVDSLIAANRRKYCVNIFKRKKDLLAYSIFYGYRTLSFRKYLAIIPRGKNTVKGATSVLLLKIMERGNNAQQSHPSILWPNTEISFVDRLQTYRRR